MPGFIHWRENAVDSLDLTEREKGVFDTLDSEEDLGLYLEQLFLDIESRKKGKKEAEAAELKSVLLGLCAFYLVEEKKNGQALDRVAHFHLSNGAQVERVNWGGNTTVAGYQQSASIMVNYLYNLSQIEKNHELYTGKGEIVVSSQVRKFLKR